MYLLMVIHLVNYIAVDGKEGYVDIKDSDEEVYGHVITRQDENQFIVVASEGINKTEMEIGERVYGPPNLFGLLCGEGKAYYIDGYCDIKIVENETVLSNSLPCYFICNCDVHLHNVNGTCLLRNLNEEFFDVWKAPTTPISFDKLTSATSINLLGVEIYGLPYISGRGCGKNMIYEKVTKCDFVFSYDYKNGNKSLPCQFVCKCVKDFLARNGTCVSKYEIEENFIIIPPEGVYRTVLHSDDLIYGPPNLAGVICGKYKEYHIKELCHIYIIENNRFYNYLLPCYYSCNCIKGYYDDKGTCIISHNETFVPKIIENLDHWDSKRNLPHQNGVFTDITSGSKNLLREVVYGFPSLKGRGCGTNMIYLSLSSCNNEFSFDDRPGKPEMPCKFECACNQNSSELYGKCLNNSYISTLPSKLGDITYDLKLVHQSCGEYMTYNTIKSCALPFSYDRKERQYLPCTFKCMCNIGYKSYLGICVKDRKHNIN